MSVFIHSSGALTVCTAGADCAYKLQPNVDRTTAAIAKTIRRFIPHLSATQFRAKEERLYPLPLWILHARHSKPRPPRLYLRNASCAPASSPNCGHVGTFVRRTATSGKWSAAAGCGDSTRWRNEESATNVRAVRSRGIFTRGKLARRLRLRYSRPRRTCPSPI